MANKRFRKRKPYTLRQVQTIGSHALLTAENLLLSPESTPGQKLQACNSISALLNSYARLYEATELETRIQILEGKQNESK